MDRGKAEHGRIRRERRTGLSRPPSPGASPGFGVTHRASRSVGVSALSGDDPLRVSSGAHLTTSRRRVLSCPRGNKLNGKTVKRRVLLPRPRQVHAQVHHSRTGNIRCQSNPCWAPLRILLNDTCNIELAREIAGVFRRIHGEKRHTELTIVHHCREPLQSFPAGIPCS